MAFLLVSLIWNNGIDKERMEWIAQVQQKAMKYVLYM